MRVHFIIVSTLFVLLNSCSEVLNDVKKQISKPTREDLKVDIEGQELNGYEILCDDEHLENLEIVSSSEESGNANNLNDDKYIFEVNIKYRNPDNLSEYEGQLTVSYKLNDSWSKWELNQIKGDLIEVFNASNLEKPNQSKIMNDIIGSVVGVYEKEDTVKQFGSWRFEYLQEFTEFQVQEYSIIEGINKGEYILKTKVNCRLQGYTNDYLETYTGALDVFYVSSKSKNFWTFNKVSGKVLYTESHQNRFLRNFGGFLQNM